MRVRVLLDKCIGAGNCLVAEDTFDQAEDGIVILKRESPTEDEFEAVREAALLCPGAAIIVDEE
jgi:ferredoxin